MTDGLSLDVIVSFSEIFDENPESLEYYLKGINRQILLNTAAFFLGFRNHNSEFAEYGDFLSMYFRKENEKIGSEIFFRLNKLQEKTNGRLVIVYPVTMLQLFEFCFQNSNDEETQTESEIEVSVFKAILFLNEENINLQKKSGTSTKEVSASLALPALALSQTFPYSDLVNYDISEVLTGQLIKSIFLFEFLEVNDATTILLKNFLENFGCGDWKYFLKSIFPLAIPVLNPQKEAHIDIIIQKGEKFQEGWTIFRKLIVGDEEILDGYDFKKIRSKPFYKVEEGIYRMINGLFVVELVHKGLYFKLTEINNSLPVISQIKNFRSFYCDEFSEKYLFYKLLQSIYKNKYIEYSGEELKEFGVSAEPDYYIRNGNNIFLFESKDIMINASIKSSYDFDLYDSEFKKKLYFDIKDEKIQKKAVLQLIYTIERLLLKKLDFDTNYKSTSIHIYPILILHDRQFNVAGLNVIVNNWFQEELKKLKEKGIQVDKVKPLTIIDIDTLIFHQDLFRDKVLKLNLILDEYFKFITFDQKRKYTSKEHVMRYAKRTIMNFSLFISNYVIDHKIRRVPKMLIEKGITLLK